MGFTLVQTLGFPIRFYPFPTVPIPSSTQNAPGFGCFRLKSGAFFSFSLFSGCKIFVLVFVHFAAQWLQVKAVCDAM